jgi:hypothetical protein
MPTGYTYIIHDNPETVTFSDYLHRCVRAFGACIAQKEEGMDTGIKMPEPETYHDQALAEASLKLEELQSRTDSEWGEVFFEEREQSLKRHHARCEKQRQVYKAHQNILAQARAWEPPTPAHESLKQFMVSQLAEVDRVGYPDPEFQFSDFETWKADVLESARWSVDYHREEMTKARARYEERRAWLEALPLTFIADPPTA